MKGNTRFHAFGVRAAALMGASPIAICTLLVAAPVSAQTAPPADQPQQASTVAEVVVTGFRGSLQSAAAEKRAAVGVIDAIASEDLGKFPDANVAESLQRIPGVSIDRDDGEGKSVTVRGLGPSFNEVLFNGRSFASDNYSRAFSFDLLPSELISGAQVYKTALATLQDGGIGATINLQTARPLDHQGFRAVFTAKGLYEVDSKETTPELFGLISDTFGGGKFGILASVSYQARTANIHDINSNGYVTVDSSTFGSGNNLTLFPAGTSINAPRTEQISNIIDRRTRTGATLVAQYRPSNELTVTLDALYNKFDSKQNIRAVGTWFEPSSYTAATIDKSNTITSLTTNGHADFINNSQERPTTTYETGLNIDWRPTDRLRVKFDATGSRADDAGGGKTVFTVIGTPTAYSWTQATGDGYPSVFGFSPGVFTDPTLGRTHIALVQGNTIKEDVAEFKLDAEWKADIGVLKALRSGAIMTRRDRSNVPIGSAPNLTCVYCGYPTASDPSLLHSFSLGSFGAGGSVPTEIFAYNPWAYLNYLASPAATSALDAVKNNPAGTTAAIYAAANGYAATAQPSAEVKETVSGAYLDSDFGWDLMGMPWFLNAGLRYEHTELTSFGQQQQLLDLLPVAGDPTIYNAVYANNGAAIPVSVKSNYDGLLPDFNLRVTVAPKVVLRLAGSQTITRPQLTDLSPDLAYGTIRPALLTASSGNPNLKPYKSTNFDFSAEWYPNRSTTLSGAVFLKHVNNFIITTLTPVDFHIANAGNLPVGGFITGPNTAQFTVSSPHNTGSMDIRGVELNLVHSLVWAPGFWSGFGVQANATFVNTNRPFNAAVTNQAFAAEGLGNSQNVTLFYEKYGLSARIAYNVRDRFLQKLFSYQGQPEFVRTYGQVDGSISYDVRSNMQVFFEGTNMLNAKYVTTGRYSNELVDYQLTGPRYDVGVRLKF